MYHVISTLVHVVEVGYHRESVPVDNPQYLPTGNTADTFY